MNKIATNTLFDIQLFSKVLVCNNCGKEFSPRQKNQKFCCPKCKRVFFQHKEAARIKARFEYIQNNRVPLPANLSEADKEAVRLYTDPTRKRKLGIRAIASLQDRSHSQIRRVLIDAGVYAPTLEQNRLKRKGTGKFSMVLRRERVAKREQGWRDKMAVCLWNCYRNKVPIKVTCDLNKWRFPSIVRRLKERSIYRKWSVLNPSKDENLSNHRHVRIWRHRVAVCLWSFYRFKKSVETTCHAKGWNPSQIWNYLHTNNAYKQLKASRPSKPYNVQQYEYARKNNWRSKKYANEDEFQDVIEELLKQSKINYIREKVLPSGKEVDFELNETTFIECKISTKSSGFSRGVGQALLYKALKKEVWVVIPDDVKISDDQCKLLQQHEIQVYSEAELRKKFSTL